MKVTATIGIVVLTTGVLLGASDAVGQCVETKHTPADRELDDRFGISMAMDGDFAVIGAHFDDDNGDNSGSAYIFTFDGSTWVEHFKLLASDGEFIDDFGASVGISGDYTVVGAPGPFLSPDRSGAAYVYLRQGASWIEQEQLAPLDPSVDNFFGVSVAIDGEYAVVGAKGKDDGATNAVAAYIFRRTGSTWSQEAKLTASDPREHALFGTAVAIDADVVVVGAPGADIPGCTGTCNHGAAYVYRRDRVT